VSPHFRCVVHILESEAESIPAPFLNRFEKYRLTLHDMFVALWSRYGQLLSIAQKAKGRVRNVARLLQNGSRFGWISEAETIESIFVGILSIDVKEALSEGRTALDFDFRGDESLGCSLVRFLAEITSLHISTIERHLASIVRVGSDSLLTDEKILLSAPVQDENMETLRKAYQAVLSTSVDFQQQTSKYFHVIRKLLTMVLTSYGVEKVLQITPPEVIFERRYVAPLHVSFPLTSSVCFS
jgi:hypothetical protein